VTLRERLVALFPEASGHRRKQWLATGRVRVNGHVARDGRVAVAAADAVELGVAAGRVTPAALAGGVRIVHEDEHLVVIDKPPGLLTIATERERERTAYRIVRSHVSKRRPGPVFIVHRLDRETSGLLVFATSPAVKRALQAQFEARTVTRVYAARVEGVVRDQEGTLTDHLVEDRALRVRTVRGRAGQEAITRYRVVERHRDATVLELTLVTGRRGQIRAQLGAWGHPIVGDRSHGSRRDPLRRVCLHATRLAFIHPDGRRVSFESPPPPGFRRG
jgi:23S rRNA pseudouridine1911/1915/1917 synthase